MSGVWLASLYFSSSPLLTPAFPSVVSPTESIEDGILYWGKLCPGIESYSPGRPTTPKNHAKKDIFRSWLGTYSYTTLYYIALIDPPMSLFSFIFIQTGVLHRYFSPYNISA